VNESGTTDRFIGEGGGRFGLLFQGLIEKLKRSLSTEGEISLHREGGKKGTEDGLAEKLLIETGSYHHLLKKREKRSRYDVQEKPKGLFK